MLTLHYIFDDDPSLLVIIIGYIAKFLPRLQILHSGPWKNILRSLKPAVCKCFVWNVSQILQKTVLPEFIFNKKACQSTI